MEISDIKIKKFERDSNLLGYASITFDGCFVVHGIKILHGSRGNYIAMPGKKSALGVFKDIAHPMNTEYRKLIQSKILEKWESENV